MLPVELQSAFASQTDSECNYTNKISINKQSCELLSKFVYICIGNNSAKGLEGNPAKTGEIFTDQCAYVKNSGQSRKQRDKTEEQCEEVAHRLFKYSAKQSPLLSKTCQCEINGVQRDVHFADWGISETAHSMHGKKRMYWLKNEILNNPEWYFRKASYVGEAEVDLSHNTNKNTLRLKRKFRKYYYCETMLADGQTAYLNIVLHYDGNITYTP